MQKTKIEYLDYTCNPIAMRCSPVSAGCANCWHIAMCDRMKNNPKIPMELREIYAGDAPPKLIESRLEAPLKLKKPAIIGLQFMGDLWHEDIPHTLIDDIFDVMTAAKQHAFIVLTKRPQNMLEWYNETIILGGGDYLPNLWLGVSVEDQKTADERIPILLQIPAAKHIVSYEPALGPVNFNLCHKCQIDPSQCEEHNHIDWVIAGCESGPNRRPAKIEWFRDVKNQCVEAGIPYFLKQMTKKTEIKNAYSTGKYFDKIVKMPELDGKIYDELPS